jgi:hypothetical protein
MVAPGFGVGLWVLALYVMACPPSSASSSSPGVADRASDGVEDLHLPDQQPTRTADLVTLLDGLARVGVRFPLIVCRIKAEDHAGRI